MSSPLWRTIDFYVREDVETQPESILSHIERAYRAYGLGHYDICHDMLNQLEKTDYSWTARLLHAACLVRMSELPSALGVSAISFSHDRIHNGNVLLVVAAAIDEFEAASQTVSLRWNEFGSFWEDVESSVSMGILKEDSLQPKDRKLVGMLAVSLVSAALFKCPKLPSKVLAIQEMASPNAVSAASELAYTALKRSIIPESRFLVANYVLSQNPPVKGFRLRAIVPAIQDVIDYLRRNGTPK